MNNKDLTTWIMPSSLETLQFFCSSLLKNTKISSALLHFLSKKSTVPEEGETCFDVSCHHTFNTVGREESDVPGLKWVLIGEVGSTSLGL